MTQEQIEAGLTTLSPTHPFYLALLGLLDQDVAEESDAVVLPDLTDSARQFNAGRLAHARDIRRAVEGAVTALQLKLEAEQRKEQARAERRGN